MTVHIYGSIVKGVSSGHIPRCGNAGWMGKCIYNFVIVKHPFPMVAPFCTVTQECLFPTSSRIESVKLLNPDNLIGEKWHFGVILIYISLIKKVDHLFMYFRKCFSIFFCELLTYAFCPFLVFSPFIKNNILEILACDIHCGYFTIIICLFTLLMYIFW